MSAHRASEPRSISDAGARRLHEARLRGVSTTRCRRIIGKIPRQMAQSRAPDGLVLGDRGQPRPVQRHDAKLHQEHGPGRALMRPQRRKRLTLPAAIAASSPGRLNMPASFR